MRFAASLVLTLLACSPADTPREAGEQAPARANEPAPSEPIPVEPTPTPTPTPSEPTPSRPTPSASAYADAMACTGSYAQGPVRCELLRARVEGLSSDAVMKEARFVVSRGAGVQLSGVRRTELLGSLGLRNRDLVVRVGETRLDTKTAMVSLLEQPLVFPLELEFEREGELQRLTIELVDRLSGPARTLVDDPPLDAAAPQLGAVGGLCLPDRPACELDADALKSALAAVDAAPRFIPAMREGVAIGVKVYGLRPDSVHARVGLRNGDLLVRLDGVAIAGEPHDPLRGPLARLAAGELAQVELELERRGSPLVQRFVLR